MTQVIKEGMGTEGTGQEQRGGKGWAGIVEEEDRWVFCRVGNV